MSKRFTDGYFALGLTIGSSVVLFAFLFGQNVYDLAKCYHTAQCERSAAKYEGKDFPSSWWWDWTGSLVTSHDTLAQWIMSFFTIAAVLLVWRTLLATHEMVEDTKRMTRDAREIGEAQVRAYIGCTHCRVHNIRAGQPIFLQMTIKNAGQSPARNYSHRFDVRVVSSPPNEYKVRGLGDIVSNQGELPAGGEIVIADSAERLLSQAEVDGLYAGSHHLIIAGFVSYKTVFGELRRSVFRFKNVFWENGTTAIIGPYGRNNVSN